LGLGEGLTTPHRKRASC